MLIDEGILDNVLVDQKNTLLNRINEVVVDKDNLEIVNQLDVLEDVLKVLEFNTPLWMTFEYGYKLKEIAYRVEKLLHNTESTLHHRQLRIKEFILVLLRRCHNLQGS